MEKTKIDDNDRMGYMIMITFIFLLKIKLKLRIFNCLSPMLIIRRIEALTQDSKKLATELTSF